MDTVSNRQSYQPNPTPLNAATASATSPMSPLPPALKNGMYTTSDYISGITKNSLDALINSSQINTMSLSEVKQKVYCDVTTTILSLNGVLDRSQQIKRPKDFSPNQMAMIAKAKFQIRNISCAGMENDPEYDVLGVYQEGGPLKGTYDTSETVFHSIARELKSEYSRNEFFEFIQALKDTCERVACYQGGRYIAVNNGLIDYEDQCHPKRLLPFTPDLVILNKSRVDYVANAPLAIIHNGKDGTDWTVEEFIDSLVDSPEVRKLLWQILGAFIRPGGSKTAKETEGWGGFGKCILLISAVGCNGKGTFCQLVRNLCGPGTVMSIALDRLGDRFLLEPLIGKTAIISDESNVGHYLEECSDLKSLVTHDPIQINRKGRKPVEYTFCGMTMFCLNEMARVKDKSNSFLRRLLCINFPKTFQACERKYVRDDYINRPEVLEYVLCKVINLPNYYKLDEPQECKELLADFALQNDPVRQFLDEILHRCVWHLLPFTFLHDLYVSYSRRVNPSGSPLGKQAFISSLLDLLPEYPDWECPDAPPRNGQPGKPGKKVQRAPGTRMNDPEPLIVEYDLKNWMNPAYRGTDFDMLAHPVLKAAYRGIQRRGCP